METNKKATSRAVKHMSMVNYIKLMETDTRGFLIIIKRLAMVQNILQAEIDWRVTG